MNHLGEKLSEALDKEIICVECKQPFLFTVGEQSYYASREFSDPKRCKPCLKKRREAKEAEQKQT
jgi:hypothetical protein